MSLSGRDTLLKRYNVDNPMLVPEFAKKAGTGHLQTMIKEQGENWAKSLFQRVSDKYGGVHPMNATATSQSRAESEIIDALVNLGVDPSDVIQGDRKVLSGKEIDVYLPKWNLGIEMCGEYWHSETAKKDKLHVFHKFEMAKANGVQLITVFEREWKTRRLQIINLIASKIFDLPRIYARNCEFVEITLEQAKAFVAENQVQPVFKITRSFALKHGTSIVEIILFNGNKVVRLCPEIGCKVIGGASKLLKESMEALELQQVLAKSDNRFSDGNLFKTIGFKKIESNRPDHFFVDKRGRHFRTGGIDRTRIYDCGSVKWQFNRR